LRERIGLGVEDARIHELDGDLGVAERVEGKEHRAGGALAQATLDDELAYPLGCAAVVHVHCEALSSRSRTAILPRTASQCHGIVELGKVGVFALALLGSAAAVAADLRCGAQSDFLVRSDPLLAPVRPADCADGSQSPPDFSWPPQAGPRSYTVTLQFPDGHRETRTTPNNWLLWGRPIPPGGYTWQGKVDGPPGATGEGRRLA